MNAALEVFIKLENWGFGPLTWQERAEFYLLIGCLFLPIKLTPHFRHAMYFLMVGTKIFYTLATLFTNPRSPCRTLDIPLSAEVEAIALWSFSFILSIGKK